MTDQDFALATAREDLCRFLSACYYEPDHMLVQEHVFDSMQAAADRLSPELAAAARRLGAAFSASDPRDLLVDYTGLFLGAPSALAKPYGSLWLDGQARVLDASTLALEDLYRRAGFEVDSELHEPPDHIALELEFLYLLTFRCNEATRAGDEEAIASWTQLRASFLREHLGAWAGRFAETARANAGTLFYSELAGLTARFVEMERDLLPAP